MAFTTVAGFFRFEAAFRFNNLDGDRGVFGAAAPDRIATVKLEMKKPDIARRMARKSGVSHAEAADRLDRMVSQILADLRQGKEPPLPGLGKFTHGPDGQVSFEPEGGKRD
ncbi:MAG: HU family DNA-binding protein [Acidobacteriia bacterium]|nr:HU family DNA-binding protein [Terriglobia bacterium]